MQLQQREAANPFKPIYNALKTVTVASCINSVLGSGCRCVRSVPANAIGTDGAHAERQVTPVLLLCQGSQQALEVVPLR